MHSSWSIGRRLTIPLGVVVLVALCAAFARTSKPSVVISYRGFESNFLGQPIVASFALSNATSVRLDWEADAQIIGPAGWADAHQIKSSASNSTLEPKTEREVMLYPPKPTQRWRAHVRCWNHGQRWPDESTVPGRLRAFLEYRVLRLRPWRDLYSPELPSPNQRVAPMTRSAVTLRSQSEVLGALLVMAHPCRSALRYALTPHTSHV